MNKRTNAQIILPGQDGQVSTTPQKILNGEFHDWYRIILGYSDHLVSGLIDDFELKEGDSVLDPFCGTGTTLVECMKRGLNSVGVDANPSSFFAAKVKTRWTLDRQRLLALLTKVKRIYRSEIKKRTSHRDDPTYKYIVESGMLERGWISPGPLRKCIVLKNSILAANVTQRYKEPLVLALIAEVVHGASNVKFGPELYCVEPKSDADVLGEFSKRVRAMADDLSKVGGLNGRAATVIFGDSRKRHTLLECAHQPFDAIICSPPYPAEHDYTRNSRLELSFLEAVLDISSLRAIKRRMIRSHTKGIYIDDNDAALVTRNRTIQRIAEEIEDRAQDKNHGFARLYGTVIRQYFGGMRRHFRTVGPRLARDAMCAYVVGDQSSYLQVHIPTAELLARLAELEGFETVDIRRWRGRRSSTTSKYIDENVLVLKRVR